MLRVVHGNQIERVLDALIARAADHDPLAPLTIAVGGGAVRRWLTLRLASALDVIAGLDTPSLGGALARELTGDAAARAAGLTAMSRDQLQAAFASVLAAGDADASDRDALGPLARYLGTSAAPADVRRVQLAARLGTLWWDYGRTRPDWLDAWDAGQAAPGLATELAGDERWQRALHGRLTVLLAEHARATGVVLAPTARLLAARRRLRLPPLGPGAPLHVVGVSYLAPSELTALAALAEQREVIVYQLDPCAEFWEDLPVRGRARTGLRPGTRRTPGVLVEAPDDAAPEPLLLQLWGRPARDTIASLTALADGDLTPCFVDEADDADGAVPTALARLRADAALRAAPPSPPRPIVGAGVRVLACPSPARELEIVAAEIASLLAADPTLRAPDVAVLIAGERDAYQPLVASIFDEVARLPHHVLGAAASDHGRLPEAFLRVLELPGSAFTRRDLLGVMSHPHVIARFPHCDADDWLHWATTLGVFRGADARDHAGTYLEQSPARFHWEQALQRLTLGAFLAETDDVDADPSVPFAGRRLEPEPLSGDAQASAATFVALARSLVADARWLAEQRLPLASWADVLAGVLAAYLTPLTSSDERDLGRLRATVLELRELDLDGRPVGIAEVRALLAPRVAGLHGDRGDALVHGVTVAQVAPMRPLPWRHVFVVGLGATDFPSGTAPAPYDLRREARRGDVSPRDRDRHALLELVLGARDSLTLSYVASHPVSGEALEPSAVVFELAESLAPYLGAPTASAALATLTTRHPMHRWSARYAEPALATAAVAHAVVERDAAQVHAALADALAAAGGDASAATIRAAARQVPGAAGEALRARLAMPPPPPSSAPPSGVMALHLSALRAFLESPVQAWAAEVLGLEQRDDEDEAEVADEPLAVLPRVRAVLLRDAVTCALRRPERSLHDAWDAAAARRARCGELPTGAFEAAARTRDVELLLQWFDALPPRDRATLRRVGLGRGGDDVTELLPALRLDVPGAPGQAGHRVALGGITEMLLAPGGTVVVRQSDGDSRQDAYHVRAALDHVVLAAAGVLADVPHRHHVLGGDGKVVTVEHAPWRQADAQAYLVDLLGDLLGGDHAYLLPLPLALATLTGGRASVPDKYVLGHGPIERADELTVPDEATRLAMATRRLAPLVARADGWPKGARTTDGEAAPRRSRA